MNLNFVLALKDGENERFVLASELMEEAKMRQERFLKASGL